MRVMSTSTGPDLEMPVKPIHDGSPRRSHQSVTGFLFRFRDVIICLGLILPAWWLTAGLWPDPDTRTLALNPADQVLVEWFLSYGSRFWVGDFSLVTDRLNAPDGVNLLTNAATVGLGVLFAPVTWAFGATATFAVIMAVNLAGTAIGWYLLFSRTLRAGRPAAVIGALFCGFAPGMVSQANSHLHMTAQWLVPVMIWCVIAMWRAAEARGNTSRLVLIGAGFGLLVTAQVFIGEETLFLTALTLVFISVAYVVLTKPPWARVWRFTAGLSIAVAVAVPLLAYPLWLQFKGPQSVPNGVFSPDYFIADLASFVAISPLSLMGEPESARLSTGPAEYNTFLGWPLVLLLAGLVLWLHRQAMVVSCFLAGLLMALLSLGPRVVVNREPTTVDGLYVLLKGVPVIDGALPLRFALAAIPLIAILLVLGLEQARRHHLLAVRVAVPVLVAVALLPLIPAPLPTEDRDPVPVFYSEGHWRQCAEPGEVIVPVPLPTPPEPEAMRFATAQNVAFGLPEGFFIGPYGRNGNATIGTWKRPTSALLAQVARTGRLEPIDDRVRAQARTDLARWKASCVVLTEHPYHEQLRLTVEDLLGPGQRVADAVIWPL